MKKRDYATEFAKEQDLNYLRSVATLLSFENERLQERLAAFEHAANPPAGLQEELQIIKEKVDRREQELFGKSSERRPAPEAPTATEPKKPRKGHGPREQNQLKIERVPHTLPADQLACPHCGDQLSPMPGQYEISQEITVLAREFAVRQHQRQKYRCACNGHIATAPLPVKLMPGGRYSVEFAVEVALCKYGVHLPLARQVEMMAEAGLKIDSQTLWDQLDALAKLLKPTYLAIHRAILTEPVIHADETRWPMMRNGKTLENKTWYAWCIAGSELVGYRLLAGRGKNEGAQLLEGYAGVVVADGYAVYQALATDRRSTKIGDKPRPTFEVSVCWAHARRKFVEADPHYPGACRFALEIIGELFGIERELQDLSPDERLRIRQQRSAPLVDRLYVWASVQQALPRSGLGEALTYLRNQKTGLMRFLSNPAIPMSNNKAERAERAVVLGRKNHLGSRSQRGAEVTAIMYTVLESAKNAGLSRKDYLIAVARAALENPNAVLLPAEFKANLVIKDLEPA